MFRDCMNCIANSIGVLSDLLWHSVQYLTSKLITMWDKVVSPSSRIRSARKNRNNHQRNTTRCRMSYCVLGMLLFTFLILILHLDDVVIQDTSSRTNHPRLNSTQLNSTTYSWSNLYQRAEIKLFAEQIPVRFIHVGKSGGGSAGTMLSSIFSDFHHFHFELPTEATLEGAQIILILRDPLQRFASGYKWSKYQGKKAFGYKISKQIWNCFPTLTYLGEHCLDDTPCARLLQGELMPNQSTYHMGMGLRYYLQAVDLDKFKDNVHVIQQERLADDFNRVVSDILNITVNITLSREHNQYPQKNDSIPQRYHGRVKQLLHEEYVVYDQIKATYAD